MISFLCNAIKWFTGEVSAGGTVIYYSGGTQRTSNRILSKSMFALKAPIIKITLFLLWVIYVGSQSNRDKRLNLQTAVVAVS